MFFFSKGFSMFFFLRVFLCFFFSKGFSMFFFFFF